VRRPLLAGWVLVLALGACSTTATSSPQAALPSPSPTAPPDMWSVHRDARQGFSVATPDAWELVTRDSPSFDADIRTVSAHSPELGQYFADSFVKHDQLRLLAADPATLQQGFATNINVMISDLGVTAGAPSLQDATRAKVKRLGAAPDLGRVLQQHRDRLSAMDAVRLDYVITAGAGAVQVRSLLATVERGGRRYLVELTMGAARADAEIVFPAEQRLFRLFAPATVSPSRSVLPTPAPSANSGQASSG
jgi:hypothetical protein